MLQLSDKAKLKLVCFLEESDDVNPLLVGVVFNNGAEGIDNICGKVLLLKIATIFDATSSSL